LHDASHEVESTATETPSWAAPEASNENLTGMPDQLKSNLESMSGFDMSDVRVHRHSDKPAQIGALAYAQGSDIHLGPGQEQHLGHEAWHVVQQKQGRVRPTMQFKGHLNINDDSGLEAEADRMGAIAMNSGSKSGFLNTEKQAAGAAVVQAKLVHPDGTEFSASEIAYLKAEQRGLGRDKDAEIDAYEAAAENYTVRSAKSGLSFSAYRPPSSWTWSMSKGHHSSTGVDGPYKGMHAAGSHIRLKREGFPADFTEELLDDEPGYVDAEPIAGGAGLQESGVARTHHLADSSIRAIVQRLAHNRAMWSTYAGGMERVLNWIKALTHGTAHNPHAILQALLDAKNDRDLEAIVAPLSANSWNVGFGVASTNSKIGPLFDGSRYRSGYPTERTFLIQWATENLRGLVEPSVLAGALGELVDDETGHPVTSMTVEGPPPASEPPSSPTPSEALEFGEGYEDFAAASEHHDEWSVAAAHDESDRESVAESEFEPDLYRGAGGQLFAMNDPRIQSAGQCLWDTLEHFGFDEDTLQAAAADAGLVYGNHVYLDQVQALLNAYHAIDDHGPIQVVIDVFNIQNPFKPTGQRVINVGDGDGAPHIFHIALIVDPDGNGHFVPPYG